MVKKLVVLFIIFSSWALAALQYLEKSIVPKTAFETVGTSWGASDDSSTQVNIGFAFPFNGTSYSNVWISSNGLLSFSSSNTAYTNSNLPYTSEAQSVYPYWDDLNPANGGSITYGMLGTTPNRHFVISWNNVPHYPSTGSYSFQVVLYENGTIRFRYNSSSSTNGSSATVGVQENTSNYEVHSYNNSSIFDASKDILYTLSSANLAMSKVSCTISDLVNGANNPKRIPGATIRYAIEITNTGALNAEDVIVSDTLSDDFDTSSIQNLQIQNGNCDCLGVASASNNGVDGTANGEVPIKLDFGTILSGSTTTPTVECGYFEVDLQ